MGHRIGSLVSGFTRIFRYGNISRHAWTWALVTRARILLARNVSGIRDTGSRLIMML